MHQRKKPTVSSFGNYLPRSALNFAYGKSVYALSSGQSAAEPHPRRSAALAVSRLYWCADVIVPSVWLWVALRSDEGNRAKCLAISVRLQPKGLTATGVAPTPLRATGEVPT